MTSLGLGFSSINTIDYNYIAWQLNTLGLALGKIRTDKKLTKKILSQRTNISSHKICNYEQRQTDNCNFNELQILCDALDVLTVELFPSELNKRKNRRIS
jgi:DNA-binding Xre family transcriptional regulator